MTIPVWVLLGFAAWTILILIATVGIYRWSNVLSGKANLFDFPGDAPHGRDWYRRAMRAHANCIENLPIYTAIVVVLVVTRLESTTLNILSIIILVARILQSLTHILFPLTNIAVAKRFLFFITQIICMIWMGIYICLHVA